ncbi:MAG TPA: peptidoglycan bridge formation glycyltransferase FemA/FemB family protein [Candidatus Saccharimonadales bacterium]|nr:peptidoglycan bridge formation glycyltransferase FemA/FemB family protein [Candidatus Saccharimonadales bacterium]
MLKVKEITTRKTWEDFLSTTYTGFFPFFQTWDWGEVQMKLGFTTVRLGLFENESLIGLVQIVEIKAKRGKYLHLRHGPVLSVFTKSHVEAILTYLKVYAKESGFSFIRMSPLLPIEDKTISLVRTMGFRNAPIHNMDAEICWVLDITKSEDELLMGMRKSHRYLIKKAVKENIKIIRLENASKELDSFLRLYGQLASKRGFVAHRGLVEELEILGPQKEAVLFLAEYEGKIIGGALIDFVGPMAIYHHGATDDAYRNMSVSYLLQWEAIQEAKKRGKKMYNFWGIAPTESKKHPWYGLTLFKTGFGGEKRSFLHAMDLPLTLSYWKTFLIDMLTKVRKGY